MGRGMAQGEGRMGVDDADDVLMTIRTRGDAFPRVDMMQV